MIGSFALNRSSGDSALPVESAGGGDKKRREIYKSMHNRHAHQYTWEYL